jgi:hypothetical protein
VNAGQARDDNREQGLATMGYANAERSQRASVHMPYPPSGQAAGDSEVLPCRCGERPRSAGAGSFTRGKSPRSSSKEERGKTPPPVAAKPCSLVVTALPCRHRRALSPFMSPAGGSVAVLGQLCCAGH